MNAVDRAKNGVHMLVTADDFGKVPCTVCLGDLSLKTMCGRLHGRGSDMGVVLL